MYVWLNRLHALPMEELSSSMEWTIFRQRWQYVYYFGSNSTPISLDLACIFWNRGIQQRHQCSTKKSLGKNFLPEEYDDISFDVNSQRYSKYYLLADGIYSKWSIFVQSIKDPQGEKRKHFANKQEAARKDVERCFGALKTRWSILQQPSRLWGLCDIENVVIACCIMHNMIIDDERDYNLSTVLEPVRVEHTHRNLNFEEYLQGQVKIQNRKQHFQLRNDLIEHLWSLKGNL